MFSTIWGNIHVWVFQRLAWCTRPRILRVRAWIRCDGSGFCYTDPPPPAASSVTARWSCSPRHSATTHTHRETQNYTEFFSYADQDFKVVIYSSDGRTEFSSAINPVKCHMILQNPNFYLSQKNSDPIHTIPQYKKTTWGGGDMKQSTCSRSCWLTLDTLKPLLPLGSTQKAINESLTQLKTTQTW